MPKSDYSIRWSGKLRIATAGLYTLAMQANPGGRLVLDGKMLIDKPVGSRHYTAQKVDLQISAGLHELQIDYFEGTGVAKCILFWIPPGALTLTPIPADALYHDDDPLDQMNR